MVTIRSMFDTEDFMRTGNIRAYERRAAQRAIGEEREIWLPRLESYRAELPMVTTADVLWAAFVDAEIRRLRRLLGVPVPPSAGDTARRRERTRERVRRYRQRRKTTADAGQ